MTIAGIDPSMTRTAVYLGPGEWVQLQGKKRRATERLEYFYRALRSVMHDHAVERVVIEGYAFAAQARHHRIGELGGVLRLACMHAGVRELFEVPPSALKKFFANSGQATKSDMVLEATSRNGGPVPNDDVADACALWHAGHDKTFLHKKAEYDPLGRG